VGGSGLIYAVIAILWAVVLIPMWLRNHDTAAENRSAERFGQAMRVLSRKEQAVEAEDAETSPAERESAPGPAHERPAAGAGRPATVPAVRPSPRAAARPAQRRAPRQRPQRTLAQRRARTLAVLTGLALLLALAAAVTPVPWWAPLPAVTLLGLFVVHLRVQARQQQHRQPGQARQRTSEPKTGTVTAPEFERSFSGFVSGPSRAVVVETKGARTAADVTFDDGVLLSDEQRPNDRGESEGDETWRPNELPLPTYVTAPKAIRPIKVIDLTTPGAWSSGRLLDDGVSEEDLLAAEVADAELDALLEQEVAEPATSDDHDEAARRAVGD
jgi:membrane protein implicated in regulation of membrane protease activity